jgi:hypothetical protein
MELHTSGDVKAAAEAQGVPSDRLDEFIRMFHMKTAYMKPEAAFASCMILEKNAAYGGRYGQIPPRTLSTH